MLKAKVVTTYALLSKHKTAMATFQLFLKTTLRARCDLNRSGKTISVEKRFLAVLAKAVLLRFFWKIMYMYRLSTDYWYTYVTGSRAVNALVSRYCTRMCTLLDFCGTTYSNKHIARIKTKINTNKHRSKTDNPASTTHAL